MTLVGQRSLFECEQVIERGLDTFVEVGVALMEIRDGRLYRETHSTFETYCQERWKFTDRHARRLIEASEIAGALESGPIGPVSESQTRELAPLKDDPEKMAEAWSEAVREANGKPTAVQVANAVNKITHVHYCRAPGCSKSFPYPVKHCANCDRHYGGASHDCELAEAKEREADRLAALQRDKTRLELLVDGWISLTSLPAHPDREELLALLNDHDRKTVLAIEAMYLEAK